MVGITLIYKWYCAKSQTKQTSLKMSRSYKKGWSDQIKHDPVVQGNLSKYTPEFSCMRNVQTIDMLLLYSENRCMRPRRLWGLVGLHPDVNSSKVYGPKTCILILRDFFISEITVDNCYFLISPVFSFVWRFNSSPFFPLLYNIFAWWTIEMVQWVKSFVVRPNGPISGIYVLGRRRKP